MFSIVPHYHLLLGGIALIYIIIGVAMLAYYMETRCPYSSLVACQEANKGICGDDIVHGLDDCERFTKITEPCYCDKCRFCLSADQNAHCNVSVDNRLKICKTRME